ncbi:baseplate J/gp47 family protein [Leptospira levettii]|uniref:baseplate J/gp47 family protein n=1 Tax=Leptospira levettii TaxID=2023178 RepID=UPI00223D2552|nr:baseplate J/gp47 family protein [Leptospira levettii]MCW7467515.1 baseplate J/gp47 family protein [Leptospira levettii]
MDKASIPSENQLIYIKNACKMSPLLPLSLPMSTAYAPRTFLAYFSNIMAYIVGAGVRLTNWKPGSRIRTLVEAIALLLSRGDAEFFAGYQYARDNACYDSFNFGLLPGNKATGYIRYNHTGHTSNIDIPVFAISLFGITYKTIQPATLLVGDTSVDIDIIADELGTKGNLVPLEIDTDQGKGEIYNPIDPNEILTYDRIFNPVNITGGTDQETEESRQARWQEFITNLARSTLSGIRSAVRSVPGVVDSFVTENINPYTGDPETGWINVYISDGTGSVDPLIVTAVRNKIDGIEGTDELGYRAGGTTLYVGNILTQAINVDYELDVLLTSSVSNATFKSLVETSISNAVNRLSNGSDVLLDLMRAAALNSHPDILRIRFLTPSSDVSVPSGALPKIGGTGGGTITNSAINRIPRP